MKMINKPGTIKHTVSFAFQHLDDYTTYVITESEIRSARMFVSHIGVIKIWHRENNARKIALSESTGLICYMYYICVCDLNSIIIYFPYEARDHWFHWISDIFSCVIKIHEHEHKILRFSKTEKKQYWYFKIQFFMAIQ